MWTHVENYADFWEKNVFNEWNFLCSKAKRYRVTQWDILLWGKSPRGRMSKGWAGQNLSPSVSHFKEPHYSQLPKGWIFQGIERLKPARLHPPSCHVPKTQHCMVAQAIIPSGLDKNVNVFARCTAQVSCDCTLWVMQALWDKEHPWTFPVQGVQPCCSLGPFAVASNAPAGAVPVAAAAVSVLLLLLLRGTNSNQAQQSPPGAADNRCLIKHLSTLQAFTLTRTKLTLNHSLITAKLY